MIRWADQQAIGKVEGVKGCFRNAGQMQIIFGTGVVNKVYAAFTQAAGISESSKSEAADIAAKKLNPFQRIARLLSKHLRADNPCHRRLWSADGPAGNGQNIRLG
ncbi:PTS system, sucrose-specific IIBC component [Escherichia coli]|nr:PTS system, sucrose-specific IIBC component [Escherichia coli]